MQWWVKTADRRYVFPVSYTVLQDVGCFLPSGGWWGCLSRLLYLCWGGDLLSSFNYSLQGLALSCRAAVRTSQAPSVGQWWRHKETLWKTSPSWALPELQTAAIVPPRDVVGDNRAQELEPRHPLSPAQRLVVFLSGSALVCQSQRASLCRATWCQMILSPLRQWHFNAQYDKHWEEVTWIPIFCNCLYIKPIHSIVFIKKTKNVERLKMVQGIVVFALWILCTTKCRVIVQLKRVFFFTQQTPWHTGNPSKKLFIVMRCQDFLSPPSCWHY